ncbi:MAG TPA: short-chain dehydrogenase [Gammaproteobacteria bacterium]|jgi:short-subunit dehydrogenase|nr:short-chain dehydrogenase [Gammaproteobacteria bacterium]
MRLLGKNALVTGVSRGIGSEITQQLIDRKCQLTGLSRTAPTTKFSHDAFSFQSIDFSVLNKLPEQLKTIHQKTGTLDILVCNAGYGRFGSLEEFSTAQIREMIDVNLTSQILVAREFIPAMKLAGSGHIIIMGSEAAVNGGKKGAIYSATKFALRGFSQSIREECSTQGVAVTLVNPGMVKTSFFNDLNFAPGDDQDCHLTASDVAKSVIDILQSRTGCCVDEINLSAQKKLIIKT